MKHDPEKPSVPIAPPLVVIGTSSGGTEALATLVADLPKDLPACVVVVRHLAPEASAEFLARELQKHSKIPCAEAKGGEPLQPGRLYIAPSDRHLVVDEKQTWVVPGPRENRFRPAIDPLFRSAAASHKDRVIGIVLTGLLNDGAAGLAAIKRCGGTSIVQDPEEAAYPDMPRSALKVAKADYCVPLKRMGSLIGELLLVKKSSRDASVPKEIEAEAKIAITGRSDMQTVDSLGDRSVFTCPDCGGVLWQTGEDDLTRFRCHTGHSFTAEVLLAGQSHGIEETLWRALRMFEERRNLLRLVARTKRPLPQTALEESARKDEVDINRLRELLKTSTEPPVAME